MEDKFVASLKGSIFNSGIPPNKGHTGRGVGWRGKVIYFNHSLQCVEHSQNFLNNLWPIAAMEMVNNNNNIQGPERSPAAREN